MPENEIKNREPSNLDHADIENTGNQVFGAEGLNKSQKIAVAVLAFFALFIVILWSVQFKKSITEPFTYNNKNTENSADSLNNSNNVENSEEALKNKDTDKDGLMDYDELNYYNTSPYLEDSDSDGFSDKEEIDNDKDPNCPAGRECGQVIEEIASPGTSSEEQDVFNLLNQLNSTNTQTQGDQTADNITGILGGGSDAASLRKMLIEAGMDETMLNQISDEMLMESYKEIMQNN